MANYLITMTKHLIAHFQVNPYLYLQSFSFPSSALQDKILHILPDTDMSNNYKTLYNDTDHYVMPFESFNSGVVKSKV